MSISTPFIHRPVGTTLLTVAIILAGGLAFFFLPVSPLPQVEYPTIQVSAGLPGASPETVASSIATPLERQFGRISGITEMTSQSSLGSVSIALQFDLNRNIDAAARDVQAAINAAASQLPANLPNRPSYRKVNPADAPILILALTSEIYTRGQMYDFASTVLQQKLAQVQGVGQVVVGGGALPAVRVEVSPTKLNNLGLSLEDVRTALGNANANRPLGQISDDRHSWGLQTTDQLLTAKEYQPLIVNYRNGAATRLADVADVTDSVEDIRTNGLLGNKPAILLIIFRQPGANIIDTVDRVTALMPQLQASIPPSIDMSVVMDRTLTIRASVHDVEFTLLISVALVVLVVFIFLRNVRATLIPSVVVPVSLIGTFGVMYLAGFSLDNLSLMALAIATGFVVDDAIVVIENISRHLEQGMSPIDASLRGAQEIGFTVLTISISLIAVFIPILLMGGLVGRLFREFAITLSVAIVLSMVISLTTTPMMCAVLLRSKKDENHGRAYRISERFFQGMLDIYEGMLRWVLRHHFITGVVTISMIAATIFLASVISKGLFPQQDTGRLTGQILADQNMSSQSMRKLMSQIINIVIADPDVGPTVAFSGGTANNGRMFATLKNKPARKLTADEVVGRLRGKLARIPGATLFLQPVQDLRIGARISNAQYQYTLISDDYSSLGKWATQLLAKMKNIPGLADVNSDQQNHGLEALVTVDRPTAYRLNLSARLIDNMLYDAFGQRQVSTMYRQLNQYHVVMEEDSNYIEDPAGLNHLYFQTTGGNPIPLNAFSRFSVDSTSLTVNHSGQFPSITLSFNLLPGVSLGDAVTGIQNASREIGMPASISGTFSGTAQAFQSSLANMPLLIILALVSVYLVLGILYESLIHPITIILSLPSAGVGALIALMFTHTDFSLIAFIGIILLMGIVKKNAIMMIDFAIEAERKEGKTPEEAIFQACLLRFRPIMMTTMAALLGGLPLALGNGTGAELRRPLGIAIVGGLIFSQALTLFTTPVVYLYFDRLRIWCQNLRQRLIRIPTLKSLTST